MALTVVGVGGIGGVAEASSSLHLWAPRGEVVAVVAVAGGGGEEEEELVEEVERVVAVEWTASGLGVSGGRCLVLV
jgi:hypothetical protein